MYDVKVGFYTLKFTYRALVACINFWDSNRINLFSLNIIS